MKNAMKVLFAASMLTGLVSAGAVHAQADNDVQVVEGESLSKFIRSNTAHFWTYMRTDADLSAIKGLLKFEGIGAGDPHMGNFAPIPVLKGGKNRMAFLDVDFDDAGQAPLILDFVRYMVAVKADFPDIKKKDLEEAYLRGLAGKTVEAPKPLQKFLDLSWDEYQAEAADYTEKKTKGDGFKLKPGEIESYSAEIKRSSIEELFKGRGEKVVDIATRPEAVGGSAGSTRIWILADTTEGRRIMELKEYAPSAIGNYQKQDDPGTWVKAVRAAFWPGYAADTYDLVRVEGKFFWLRQKQVSLIDVPRSSQKARKLAYAEGLAIYDANLLGLAHGRQEGGADYLAALEAKGKDMHKSLGKIVNDYMDAANAAFSSKNCESALDRKKGRR